MRRALAFAAIAGCIVGSTASSASAHSALLDSQPQAGALLEAPPGEIVLTFSEPPDPSLSRIEVLDERGEPLGPYALAQVPGARSRLQLRLPPLDDGVYTVSWRALSSVDGHLTEGAFAFGVGVGTIGAAQNEAAATEHGGFPSALSVAARLALYCGLALIVGAASTGTLVFRTGIPGRRWTILACWAIAAVGFAFLAYAEASSAGVTVPRLFDSVTGVRLIRLGILLVVTVLAVVLVVVRPGRWSFLALGVAGGAAMLAFALSGHAGAPGRFRSAIILAHWIHLVAIGVWIGGLMWLLAGMWGRAARGTATVVRRFSRLAGYALAAVVATGVFRAVIAVGSPSALIGTDYGLSVLGKMALFLPLIGLGALNRYRVLPRLERDRGRARTIRQTVAGEVVLGVGVFAVTGVMAGLVPPTQEEARAEPPATGIVVTGNDFATTIKVRLEIVPGVPGPNQFIVRVDDYDTGEPIDAARVALRFSRPDLGPALLELDPREGLWKADGTVLAVEGEWLVTVIVEAAPEGWEVPLDVTIGAAGGGEEDHGATGPAPATGTTGPTGRTTGATGTTLPPA